VFYILGDGLLKVALFFVNEGDDCSVWIGFLLIRAFKALLSKFYLGLIKDEEKGYFFNYGEGNSGDDSEKPLNGEFFLGDRRGNWLMFAI